MCCIKRDIQNAQKQPYFFENFLIYVICDEILSEKMSKIIVYKIENMWYNNNVDFWHGPMTKIKPKKAQRISSYTAKYQANDMYSAYIDTRCAFCVIFYLRKNFLTSSNKE